ncbi:MAG TPA: electron transfer flavoprotein beta subunit/FixA family protein, partial [Ginsengibacter sp.]|nr:electron transfer flavoprotein beta subunit/FixA family protein [Ginsengibacter sp.]
LINVGDPSNDAIIRKALAIGGDEAIRVNTTAGDDYYVASQMAEIAKEGHYDLILTGKETIDYNGASVGGMIAEFLQMPFISFATKFDLEGTTATVTREIEGGAEVNEVPLPIVVSCQQGVAEQRIPNMRGIMGARTKPLKVVEPKDVAVLTEIQSFDLPAPKQGVKLFAPEQAEDLVKALRDEAKVI